MERYAWAVHFLNFTMAVTERDRDREERERAKEQGASSSPATAHIMERLRRGHLVNALTRSPLAEEERKLSDYSRSSSTNTATKDASSERSSGHQDLGELLGTTSQADSGVSQRKSSSSSPMGSESDCSDSEPSSQFLSPMGPQNILDPWVF